MLFSTPPAFAAAQARLQQAHAFMEEEDLVRKDEEMDRIRASWETTRSYLKWLEFFWERAVAWRESRAAWSLDLVLEDPPREGADPSRVAFLVVRREPPRRLALAPPAPSLFDFGRGASASPVVVVVVVEIEQVVLTVVGGSGDVPAGRAKAPYVAVDVASAELAEGDAVRLQLCARGRHGFEVLAVAGPDGAAESFPDDGARAAASAEAGGAGPSPPRAGGAATGSRTSRCRCPSRPAGSPARAARRPGPRPRRARRAPRRGRRSRRAPPPPRRRRRRRTPRSRSPSASSDARRREVEADPRAPRAAIRYASGSGKGCSAPAGRATSKTLRIVETAL